MKTRNFLTEYGWGYPPSIHTQDTLTGGNEGDWTDDYSLFPISYSPSSPHVQPPAQHPLCRLFNKVQRQERQQDQQHVADPRIKGGQAEPVQHVRVVNEIPEVEVQKV